MSIWMMMDECIFVRKACWIRLEMGESRGVYPKYGSYFQVWGRLRYVRMFQLISGIQHAILQIWVCVRKEYVNESVCEVEWGLMSVCGSRCLDVLQYGGVLCGKREWESVIMIIPRDFYDLSIKPYEWTIWVIIYTDHTIPYLQIVGIHFFQVNCHFDRWTLALCQRQWC